MAKKRTLTKQSFPQGRVVLDYETTDLHPYQGGRPFIAGVEDEAGNVIKARPGDPEWHKVAKVIEDEKVEKIAHGARFEIKHSKHLGLKPSGRFHDTMAKAVLVDEYQRINLDSLSQRWLNDDSKGIVQAWLKANGPRIRRLTGREPNYSDIPKELLEKYLEGDLDKTLRLDWLWRPVETEFPELYKMETDLAWDVAAMEDMGFHIDMPYVKKMIMKLRPEMEGIEQEMHAMIGVKFNPASRFDLGDAMAAMDLDTGMVNKDSTMKTDFKSLDAMDPHPFLDKLIRWRGLQKIVGTYLIPFTQMAAGDVVHGSLWQYGQDEGIVTGRFSSSDPNLQNMPGGGRSTNKVLLELGPIVRRAVVPPPGYSMLFFDYKRIEMVIFTCLAGDKRAMVDLRAGIDPYIAQGKLLYGADAFKGLKEGDYERKRFNAKELCLSLIYGMGLKSMARRLKCSISEAKALRQAYFTASPETKEFMTSTIRDLLVYGHVTDVFGRHYHVPQDRGYKAVNAKCQGSAATVMKQGIIRARALASTGFRPIVPIHDELIGIVPTHRLEEAAYEGIRLLKDEHSFEVPIEVDAKYSHTNWAEKKSFDWAL